jgi:hypothetical protein
MNAFGRRREWWISAKSVQRSTAVWGARRLGSRTEPVSPRAPRYLFQSGAVAASEEANDIHARFFLRATPSHGSGDAASVAKIRLPNAL